MATETPKKQMTEEYINKRLKELQSQLDFLPMQKKHIVDEMRALRLSRNGGGTPNANGATPVQDSTKPPKRPPLDPNSPTPGKRRISGSHRHHHHHHKPKQTIEHKKGVKYCDRCSNARPIILCMEETLLFCVPCYAEHHEVPANAGHTRKEVGLGIFDDQKKMCEECEHNKAEWFCENEKNSYCGTCSKRIHSKEARKHHQLIDYEVYVQTDHTLLAHVGESPEAGRRPRRILSNVSNVSARSMGSTVPTTGSGTGSSHSASGSGSNATADTGSVAGSVAATETSIDLHGSVGSLVLHSTATGSGSGSSGK